MKSVAKSRSIRRRLGCLVFLASGCASPAFSPGHEIAIVDNHAAVLMLDCMDGTRLLLHSTISAFYYLREVSLEDESGHTLLEVGDDTGMKNYPSCFVPGRSEFIVNYGDILRMALRAAMNLDDAADRSILLRARTMHLTYFMERSPTWPASIADLRHERGFILAISIGEGESFGLTSACIP